MAAVLEDHKVAAQEDHKVAAQGVHKVAAQGVHKVAAQGVHKAVVPEVQRAAALEGPLVASHRLHSHHTSRHAPLAVYLSCASTIRTRRTHPQQLAGLGPNDAPSSVLVEVPAILRRNFRSLNRTPVVPELACRPCSSIRDSGT
jgi:predicted membrane-bound mannosyltransferase